jgi:hypothetical protein
MEKEERREEHFQSPDSFSECPAQPCHETSVYDKVHGLDVVTHQNRVCPIEREREGFGALSVLEGGVLGHTRPGFDHPNSIGNSLQSGSSADTSQPQSPAPSRDKR